MMALAAGDLRHFVKLEKPLTTQNPATGEMRTTWRLVAQVYAAMEPLSAREFIAAGANQSEVAGKARIRFRRDVDATMRIVHRGDAYQIIGVLPDLLSGLEYLTLPLSKGVRVA